MANKQHQPDDNNKPTPPANVGLSFDPTELEVETPDSSTGAENPFDPANLSLPQDFAAESTVKRVLDIIKVEKPSKSRIIRVHPDPVYRAKTLLLSLKEDNETYYIHPKMRKALAREPLVAVYTLFAYATKAGTPFLWPIRMQDPDGKWNVWHRSAYDIAEKAMTRWARIQANRDAGHYVAEYDMKPTELQQEPAWPDLPFSKWLELAFKDFIIDSPEHPVLRRLRMED